MGAYISIGIVYSNNDVYKIHNDLFIITEYLSHFCEKILVKYPKSNYLEDWDEKVFEGKKGLYKAFKILNTSTISFGNICYKIHNDNYNITVSIKGNNDFFKGILFEIPEEELLKNNYSNENLNNITDKIAKRLIELWNYIDFSYAFCDNEADIEYQLFELTQREETYSLLLLKNSLNQPIIKLSSWHIDGITERK